MGGLRFHLTDESFLERRRALTRLAELPFEVVRELLPEVLHCLASDDEEGQALARSLLGRHLAAKKTGADAALAVASRGLAAHGLVGVLEEIHGGAKDPLQRTMLAHALHSAGAPIDKAFPPLLDAATAGDAAAVRLLGFLGQDAARPVLKKLHKHDVPPVVAAAKAALGRLDGAPGLVSWEAREAVLGAVRPLVSRLGMQTAIAQGIAGGELDEWESDMNDDEEVVSVTTSPIDGFASADQFWVTSALGDVGGAALPPALAAIDRLDLVPIRQTEAEATLEELLASPDEPAPLALRGRFVGATRLGYGWNERELLLQTTAQYVRVFWYTTA